jgi:hypothetical protein
VFDKHGTERLAEWKNFREYLENSPDPLKDVIDFWSRAPFVSPYLDPFDSSSWPDPWRLVLDLRLDQLAISLGILYTLKLTRRFINQPIEIHMSMLPEKEQIMFPVIIAGKHVLNWEYQTVVDLDTIKGFQTTLIYEKSGEL